MNEKMKWWEWCLIAGIAVFFLGIMAAVIRLSNREDAVYEEAVAEDKRIRAYRDTWWPQHCKRFYIAGTSYMHPMFNCDDGNVYAYEDMPTGEPSK